MALDLSKWFNSNCFVIGEGRSDLRTNTGVQSDYNYYTLRESDAASEYDTSAWTRVSWSIFNLGKYSLKIALDPHHDPDLRQSYIDGSVAKRQLPRVITRRRAIWVQLLRQPLAVSKMGFTFS